MDGFDQLCDLGLARLCALAGLLDFALGGDVFLGVLGQRQLVLGAADGGFLGLKLGFLFAVVALSFGQLRAFAFQQGFHSGEIVL